MTEPQLNRLCKTWQRRCPLLFGGWDVEVKLATPARGSDADVRYWVDRQSAVIRIDPEANELPERLLLHELMHMAIDRMWDGHADTDRERVIWLVAGALMSLRPRR